MASKGSGERKITCPDCKKDIKGKKVTDPVTGEKKFVFECLCGAKVKHPTNMKIKKVIK